MARSPLFRNFGGRRDDDDQSQSGKPGQPIRYNLRDFIRKNVSKVVMQKMGDLGSLVNALLKPMGKSLAPDIDAEMDAAEKIMGHLLASEMEKMSEGGRFSDSGGGGKIPPTRPPYRVGGRPEPEADDWRTLPQNKPLIEPWIEVKSSNVWGFSYRHQLGHQGNGDLLVTFLGVVGKSRQGKGASYAYKDVPYEIFEMFKRAASAGSFVWSELRVRGSVVQHQYAYDLESTGNLQSVPRQASIRTGRAGEHFVQRTLNGVRSVLPNQQVRGPRSNLPGWERRSNLQLKSKNNGRTRAGR